MLDLPAFLIVAEGLGVAALVGDRADFPHTVIGVADGIAVGVCALYYVACTVVGILLPSAFRRLHGQDAAPAVHGIACPVATAVLCSRNHTPRIVGEGLGGPALFPASRSQELSLFVLYAVAAADLDTVCIGIPYDTVLSVVFVPFCYLPVLTAPGQVAVDVIAVKGAAVL